MSWAAKLGGLKLFPLVQTRKDGYTNSLMIIINSDGCFARYVLHSSSYNIYNHTIWVMFLEKEKSGMTELSAD